MIGSSMVKLTKENKLRALAGAFAIHISRQKKDPLYEKLIRFKKAYRVIKQQLIQKYGQKGMQAARLAASKPAAPPKKS